MLNFIGNLFKSETEKVKEIAPAIATGDYDRYDTILNAKVPTSRKLKRINEEISGWLNAPKVITNSIFASFFADKYGAPYEKAGDREYLVKERAFYQSLKDMSVEIGNNAEDKLHYILFKKDGHYLARANCLEDFFMIDMDMRVQFKNTGVKEFGVYGADKDDLQRDYMLMPEWDIYGTEDIFTPYTRWALNELILLGNGVYKSIKPEFDRFIKQVSGLQW